MSLGGIVLAGGRSRRMGRPKAWLPFGDEHLLQRVVRRLSEVCNEIVVVSAPGQTLPPLPLDVRVVSDPVEGRGPLQGIAVGLAALSKAQATAFVSSTDAPFVDPRLVSYLASLKGDAFDCVVPRALGHYHPLAAIYSRNVLPTIKQLLAEDRVRPFFVFEQVRTRFVLEDELRGALHLTSNPTAPLLALQNVNTPEELVEALRDAGLEEKECAVHPDPGVEIAALG
jgi:molybdenum cofactor guanylyltransferase